MKSGRTSVRASALLLVFWALLLLSGAVLSWAIWVQKDLVLHGEGNRALEARSMAHSGMAIGLHPLVTKLTPNPEKIVAPGLGFRVRLLSEGGKLNIKWLLAGEEPGKLAILKLWLQHRGLDFPQRERFVDCVLDYCDADNLSRLNGAEDEKGYHPKNRALRSVAELRDIRGTEPLTSQANWADDLTVYSQGPIDLVVASAEILRLLPGLRDAQIKRLIDHCLGPDGREGTVDDGQIVDMKTAQSLLGMNAEDAAVLQGLIMVNDPAMQIISTGYSGTVTRRVEVVARKTGGKPEILSWKE